MGTLDQVVKASFAVATIWLNYSWVVWGVIPNDYWVTGFLTGYFPPDFDWTNSPLTKFLYTCEKVYLWYLAKSNIVCWSNKNNIPIYNPDYN